MKIIHTSDWHLGHTLYGNERTDEFRHFFRQLSDLVAREQPDALVVSGDVFHYSSPSIEAQNLLVEGVLGLCEAAPEMLIFIIGGNHDSGSRLEIAAPLWHARNVHIVGRLHQKDEQIDVVKHVFLVPDKGVMVCVPFFNARHHQTSELFGTLIEEAERVGGGSLPVVAAAHLAVAEGLDKIPHDFVGGLDYIPLAEMKGCADYLALGHIHRPHTFAQGRARYCGTPVAIAFDEEHPHGVDVVEIAHAGEQPIIRTLPISPLRQLVTLPTEAAPLPEVLKAVEQLPTDLDAYLRLNVLVDDYLPSDTQAQASMLLDGKKARLCLVKTETVVADNITLETLGNMTIGDFQQLSPFDVALRLYEKKFNHPMADDLQTLLREAVDAVNENNTENNSGK